MKKLLITALAASAAFSAPAMAQDVNGEIMLKGKVDAKCFVVPGNGTTFGDMVDFGELADADGTLRSGLDTDFATRSFSVLCTSANPNISVDANPLANAASPDAGYDNSIDYEASVAVTTVGANNGPFDNDSSAAAPTTSAIGSRLANASSNVNITTSNYRTNAATDLLVAGNYTGNILVTISPGL